MESTIRQQSDISFDLEVTLTPEELEQYSTAVFRDAQKNIELKGFRKGHVPLTMIKKMYGKALEKGVMEEAVQKEFMKAVEQKGIEPIGPPQVTHLHRTDDGGLHFTVNYEVFPTIELGEYKGLSARRVYHRLTEDELNAELERMRENFATPEEADSVADENTLVTIDLQRMNDGEPEIGNVMRDVRLYLRNPSVNQDLKASLLNTKVGDTFRIDLPTGDDEALTNYDVTVQKIERVALPELDDELARKALGDETVTMTELTEFVRHGITSEYEKRYANYFRDELIDGLLERHPFDVPQVVVGQVLQSLIEDMKKGPNKELPKDFNQEEFVREMTPAAERIARWAILRDLIIRKEELVPDISDYEGLADIEAQRTGIDYEVLLNHFQKSEKIQDRIVAEKALQLLEDYAIVQEVEDKDVAPQARPAAAAPDHQAEEVDQPEAEPSNTEEAESM